MLGKELDYESPRARLHQQPDQNLGDQDHHD